MGKIMILTFLICPTLLASTQEAAQITDEDERARRPIPPHMMTWQEVKDGVPVAPPQSQFTQVGENMWVFEPPTPYSSPAHRRRNSR